MLSDIKHQLVGKPFPDIHLRAICASLSQKHGQVQGCLLPRGRKNETPSVSWPFVTVNVFDDFYFFSWFLPEWSCPGCLTQSHLWHNSNSNLIKTSHPIHPQIQMHSLSSEVKDHHDPSPALAPPLSQPERLHHRRVTSSHKNTVPRSCQKQLPRESWLLFPMRSLQKGLLC